MRLSLRQRFETIIATAVITSLIWLGVGLVHGGGVAAIDFRPRTDAPPATALASTQADRHGAERWAISASSAPLTIPVEGVRAGQLVDTYTQSRGGGARVHNAIDIMAPRGTRVLAAAPGTVEKLFLSKNGGITIYVRSPDRRTIYYYAHLDGYATGLSEKQQVKAGQVIGIVGATGDASADAPHLHFAISVARPDEGWWQGQPINPYPLLRR